MSSAPVWAEVVTIGSELVLGQILDTNAAHIARSLAGIGVDLAWHTTVGDDPERMAQALSAALNRCPVVIATGGIGPTEDDLTREIAARVLGRPLVFHQDLLEHIEGLFRRFGYKMTENNRRQAYIPEGAVVVPNPRGTAPAFRAEMDNRVLFCLPGVPRETEPLIHEQVIPFLRARFHLEGRVLVNRVLKVCGAGESNVDDQIKDILRAAVNPTIGLQAGAKEIKIRLTARAADAQEAEMLLDAVEARIMERIGPLVVGRGEETLAGNVAALIKARGLRLALVETLTRGGVAAELGRLLDEDQMTGQIVASPEPAIELLARAWAENDGLADVALIVAARPDGESRRIEILARTRDGRQAEKTVTLGGPQVWLVDRATVLAQYTLWNLLKDLA